VSNFRNMGAPFYVNIEEKVEISSMIVLATFAQ
jgi:hypothetical protein